MPAFWAFGYFVRKYLAVVVGGGNPSAGIALEIEENPIGLFSKSGLQGFVPVFGRSLPASFALHFGNGRSLKKPIPFPVLGHPFLDYLPSFCSKPEHFELQDEVAYVARNEHFPDLLGRHGTGCFFCQSAIVDDALIVEVLIVWFFAKVFHGQWIRSGPL